jgi:hypothetical protein
MRRPWARVARPDGNGESEPPCDQELVVASGAYLFANHLPEPVRQFRAQWSAIQVTFRIAAWSAL